MGETMPTGTSADEASISDAGPSGERTTPELGAHVDNAAIMDRDRRARIKQALVRFGVRQQCRLNSTERAVK